MKLLKVFGLVVGIHVFALILIFANPGCSSTSQPAPTAADTAVKPEQPSPAISMPATAPADSPIVAAPIAFDPNAPAVTVSAGIRYSPTRPNTAAAGALEAAPVADVTPASTYTVTKGDSLWTVAKKNHLTVSDLAAANNLKAGASLRLGQKLIIPGKALPPGAAAARAADLASAKAAPAGALAAAPSAAKASGDSMKHIVKPGETLGAIARKYQVKKNDIAVANNITDPAKIYPGMELIIPGWQAPAGKTAKTTAKAAPVPAPIPTISVTGDAPDAKPASDAPPVITVDEVPAPKKP